MPAWAATLLVGFFTVAANALLTAYYYGRLAERVDGHGREIGKREESDKDQWGAISDLRADVGKLKGKVGLNGA